MYSEGILFDFNGTMLFDEPLQNKAWRLFLENKIGRKVTEEEFQEYIHGRNAEVTLPYFLKKELTYEEVVELEEEKEKVYRELCLNSPDIFKLAKGLPEFLDELKKKKIPFTIATASALNNVKFFFEHLDLGKWFDINKVVYNDGTIPGKPEPDIYLKAADKIGVDIKKCAVFEDTKPGIEAGRRANAGRLIGITSMLDKETMLSFEGISETIEDYSDVDILFEKII